MEEQVPVGFAPRQREGREEGRGDGNRQEEFGRVDRSDGLARIAALDEQVGGDDRAPSTASRRIEEAADKAQGRDHLGRPFGVAMHDPPIEKVDSERCQVDEHERLGGRGVDRGQHIGAEDSRDHPGNCEAEEQPPVDVVMGDMADRGNGGREGLCRVDSGGCGRGRNADADEDRARNLAERHAERAVHQLGGETDEREDQERRGISEDMLENGSPPLRFPLVCLTRDAAASGVARAKLHSAGNRPISELNYARDRRTC